MGGEDETPGGIGGAAGKVGPRDLDDFLGFARGHGQTSDTRQWVSDLEDMLRVAWELFTPEQKQAFREHAEILAIQEAAGEAPGSP